MCGSEDKCGHGQKVEQMHYIHLYTVSCHVHVYSDGQFQLMCVGGVHLGSHAAIQLKLMLCHLFYLRSSNYCHFYFAFFFQRRLR